MTDKMFARASRLKLRFNTDSGPLSIEDLWDLPLKSARSTCLDDVARSLHVQLKSDDHVSFVDEASRPDETIQLRFDLVKHVIAVKVAEKQSAADAADRAARKQRIMTILAEKQDEATRNMSVEELQKLLQGL